MISHHGPWVWAGFTVLVVGMLILDLGVLNRRSHVLSMKEAVGWSAGWISLALLFGLFLWSRESLGHALEYYTGYIIELSLSVDNLFVFIVILQYFSVPAELQSRVLKWGILGAVVMRAAMILLGGLLLQRFAWISLIFGGIVILTGIRMFSQEQVRVEPERNPVIRLARRALPFTESFSGPDFFVNTSRGWQATPLLLVLLMIETTDLLFAVDSIPAIFAVTRDPFIVYSSNIFAILGLRSLFFILARMLDRFEYLKPGVAAILFFVGLKMIAGEWVHIPIGISLAIILTMLGGAVLLSILKMRRQPQVPSGES